MKLSAQVTEVDSSMLKSLTLLPTQNIMIAEFNNSTKYLYVGVTQPMYDEVINAESVGKAFNKLVKGGIDCLYHKI